jgi:hypothetical protein
MMVMSRRCSLGERVSTGEAWLGSQFLEYGSGRTELELGGLVISK